MNKCIICDNQFQKLNEYVYKCNQCKFLMSNLKPGFGREIEGISEVRKNNFKRIIKKIKSLENKDIKILEIGSGNGFFIEECNIAEIDITGSEADENQLALLKKKYNKIIQLSLPFDVSVNDLNNTFDYIVFNDVFEHLESLELVLSQLKSILNDGGKIVLNLPSSDGLIFKISNLLRKIGITNFYDRLWQKGLSSPHLSYFNSDNLKKFVCKNGYEQIYASSLITVSRNKNFERLNSTIKNKFICHFLSFFLFLFYYFQKILPKDIIFHIYKKTNISSD